MLTTRTSPSRSTRTLSMPGPSSAIHAPPLQLPHETIPMDTQPSRGCCHVASDHLDDMLDVTSLNVRERHGHVVARSLCSRCLEILGQIPDVDHRATGQDHEPLDRVGEFADIPGPGVPLENPHRSGSHALLPESPPLVSG